MRKILLSILCLTLLATSGCGFRSGPTEADITEKNAGLASLTKSRTVTVVDQPYLGAHRVPLSTNATALPPVFSRSIVLNKRGSFSALCASVSQLSGLPISVQGTPRSGSAAGSASSGAGMDADLKAALEGAGSSTPSAPGQPPTQRPMASGYRIEYSGTVKGLLDVLSSRSGLSWDYSEKIGVVFSSSNVRTWTIVAAPGTVTFSNKITNQSKETTGGASGSGGTSVQDASIQTAQTNSTDLTFDVWKDVEKEVKGMLSSTGSVTINQAAGTITVRDNAHVLRDVDRYVEDLNTRLARQIALSVKVWSLEVDDSTEAGVDLSLFFENPDVRVFAGSSPLKFLNVGGELSAAVVDGKIKNSTALLKGLRSIGNATQVTSGGGVVMSNQPVPVQATRRDAYLARSERTTSEYSDTTSLIPGEITTGFAMTVIPHILEGRRVVLQYTVNLSSLDELTNFTSGESTIQLPKVSSRSFAQRMTLKIGQTLVLAGFEQERDGRDTRGGLLGFGKSREYKRSLIIITISTESGDV